MLIINVSVDCGRHESQQVSCHVVLALLVLLLILLLFGFGFGAAISWLWIIGIVVLVLWVLGFVMGTAPAEPGPWYRRRGWYR